MPVSLLSRLDLTPEQVDLLPRKTGRAVVNFLLRWEGFADALAVLDLWRDDGFATTMDARARALSGLGHHAEAADLMVQRVAILRSVSSEQLLGEMLIRAGRIDEAHELARSMTDVYPEGIGGWSLLGDVMLVRRDLTAAERAYLRYQEIAPTRLEPSIGLATTALLRGDRVAASAYASRALSLGESGVANAQELKVLLEIVEAIPDENRMREIRAMLVERFDRELAAVVEQVEAESARGGRRRAARQERAQSAGSRAHDAAPEPPATTALETLPVDDLEVRRYTRAAHHLFGFGELLPAQAQILSRTGNGENVLAILPTGGGKSLCYQLPAFLDFADAGSSRIHSPQGGLGPLTLVVSPLIALMKDQIENLPPALAEHTLALNSSLESGEVRRRLNDLANGRYRLVYAAPERLRMWPFVDVLRRRGVARLVIDEAHCVSSWGHNFRPDYLHIAQAHRDLGAPPILALTATAPTRVRQDIEQQLFGRGDDAQRLTLIAADSFRPNLYLSAVRAANADEKKQTLLGLCHALPGSGIVYAGTRATTEEVATLLQARGESALAFHAGMSPRDRAAIQERFIAGEVRILVATVAFGMGIDKPDIRFILHFGLPHSLEAYYQEAGRAGRDGQPARCVLIYAQSDRSRLTKFANQDEMTVEFLRGVWQQVRSHMQGRNPGAIAMDDIVRETQADETQVRVALGLLEQAGLIERRYDVPRAVSLLLRAPPAPGAGRDFVQRTGLAVGREASYGYMDLCQRCGADPARLEAALLDWQAEGWLRVNGSGRDLMITIPPPPADAPQRVSTLVDRMRAVQHEQIYEIFAYARTRSCRHGYLAAYLGGAARKRCSQCDNCGADTLPAIHAGLPDEREQFTIILEAVRERGLGPRNLAKVLRGDASVSGPYKQLAAFGALAYRSESAIGKMIEDLIERGMLEEEPWKSHSVLRLSARGRQMMAMQ